MGILGGQVIIAGNKLGISHVHTLDPLHIKAYGIRVHRESGGADIVFEDFPAVTEYTPDVCKRLAAMLPDSVFSAVGKDMGLTGTDPEIFAFDKHGKVIPAWTWLQSQKDNREFYWDGVQAEFITNPTGCHNYQTDQVRNKLFQLDATLKKHDPSGYLATADVVKMDRKLLLTADEQHVNLGCSPSLNAYPEVQPIDIGNPREHPYRYSGCHIHTSITCMPIPEWFPHGTVVMIDKIAGVLLTALGRDWEDPIRRVAYGRAGEFRVPPAVPINKSVWGPMYVGQMYTRLEYRTPGAFLLAHPALFNFGVDLVRAAFRMGLLMDGRKLDEVPDVQDIINNCDADAANKLIQKRGSFFRQVLDGNFNASYSSKGKTLAILKQGAKASGHFNGSVYDNWKLAAGWNGDNYGNGATKWSSFSGT